MHRILAIGPGGAGKSTLAIKLGGILNLPVVHLDSLYWQPGWIESTRTEFSAKVDCILKEKKWIIDGNYSGTLQQRLAACDSVVFLDFPRWICLYRLVIRMIKYHGTTRADMASGCPERINVDFVRWVWNYRRHSRPKELSLVGQLNGGHNVFQLRSHLEVDEFLRSMG